MTDRRSPTADPNGRALLQSALAAARAAAPSPGDIARIGAKLPLGGGGGGGGTGGASPGAGPTTGAPPAIVVAPSIMPAVALGAALGVIASGALLIWQPPAAAPRSTPATPALVVSAQPDLAMASADAPRPPAESNAVPAPPEPTASAAAARSGPPSVVSAPAATARDDVPPSPLPASTETETHLLQRAQDALAGSPGQALALTDEHARRFPSGALGQEREVVAIQALLRLGRTGEARSRAARFLAAHPESAHRRRLEGLLAP